MSEQELLSVPLSTRPDFAGLRFAGPDASSIGASRSDTARAFSDWHERYVQYLLGCSGLDVEREPLLLGNTPDLLASDPSREGSAFVVECVAHLPLAGHDGLEGCCDGDVRRLHRNLYSRLQCKATKYRSIASLMPYVVALYDGGCVASLDTALDLALSPYAPTVLPGLDGQPEGRRYDKLWCMPEVPVALFELYPHLSGMLYSWGERRHHYLPNPYALRPLSPEVFGFAEVPELPDRYGLPGWRSRPAFLTDEFERPPDLPVPWDGMVMAA